MIDHFTISVPDLQRAVGFYEQALKPLGYGLVMAYEQYRAFGPKKKPCFFLKHAEPATPPMHIAFEAKDRAAVNAFYGAALRAGGKDAGAPGLRPHYHRSYYGAFVVDPMGHPIEAVCHAPEKAKPARAAKRKVAAAKKKKGVRR